MEMTGSQRERYRRNILLPEVGEAGQETLLEAKVLIIGLGGLGSPVALYLAAAGVGTLGLVDGDSVEISNLQRQIIHFSGDVGRKKAESAAAKLYAVNPGSTIISHECFIDDENILRIIAPYDLVIDATDSFAAKMRINDACVDQDMPLVHAGIYRYCGQVMTILPRKSACYRCAYPEADAGTPVQPPAGPLGPVAGVIGCLQAIECIKYLVGMQCLLTDTLLTVDALSMDFKKMRIRRREKCPVCGSGVEKNREIHGTITW